MSMSALKDPLATLYEVDFAAWALQQAEAIKRKDWRALDTLNLVEELESMGKQQRAELVNRLKVLLMHLAKWRHQPTLRAVKGHSWRGSIDVQRIEIERHVRKNPSLKPFIEEAMAEAWMTARIEAATETGLSRETFPVDCPFTWQEAMLEDWLPS
jgi:Domain of unknown function DUF29